MVSTLRSILDALEPCLISRTLVWSSMILRCEFWSVISELNVFKSMLKVLILGRCADSEVWICHLSTQSIERDSLKQARDMKRGYKTRTVYIPK